MDLYKPKCLKMCGPRWCIIGVCFIILQQISPLMAQTVLGRQTDPSLCPKGWIHLVSSCYYFNATKTTMSRARSSCQNQGGDLVLPLNTEEQNAIWKVAKEKKLFNPWIGLVEKQKDKFYSLDGKTPSYTNWGTSQPNTDQTEKCVVFWYFDENSKWHDVQCNQNYSYICQKTFLNSTVSRIGQPSATSSLMVSQSKLRNSTTSSGQISSILINPEPSQGSVPFSTGIVITPTRNPPILQSTLPSIQQSPVPSILQSSVLATPSLATKPVLMTSSIKEIPVLNTSTFTQASPTTSEVLPSSTVSAVVNETEKFKQDMDFINNVNTSTVDIDDKKTIERILNAAANLINTNLTTEDEKQDPGMKAVEVLENLGNSIARQLDLGNQSSFEKVSEDLVFGAAVINSNTTTSKAFSFPFDESKATGDEKIDIPSSVFVSESGKAYFVGIIFKAYREMRNNTGGLRMGTKVINAIVSPSPSDHLNKPVEMTFKKNIVNETFAQRCSFWIENSTLSGDYGRWSTWECSKTTENQSHIKCACNHLTNFAVLFKISDDQDLSEEDAFRLEIITYVGLSLSILGCLLTFIIYISLSSIKSDRAIIHTNLVLALGIADMIFLVTVVVKPEHDRDSCLATAMLAFYFYLCVFFWMLVEGAYIYLMVIKVFRGNVARRRKIAYLVGWGCPVIIAVITWAVLRGDVVSKYHCWLSVETGAIWAFVGPGLAIILINLIILLAVMRTTWATFVDDKEYGGLKSATKTFGAVIPILGITWVFGVMAFNESSLAFQYIFAITNSLQGALIFILYCIVNNEVRNELRRRIAVWQTRREMSSSSGGRRTMYPYVVSSEKNTTFNRTTASAQETPDLYRYALSDMKETSPSGRIERMYSFEDPNVTPKNDSKLGVHEKDSHQEKEGDREKGDREEGDRKSGRSSPIELGKNSGDNDVCDDNAGPDV